MVVAVGIGAGFVALLRDVDFAADDRMDALGFGRVVELHRAEEVAVVGHGHGGHFLLGDDVHQLADFAGAVEEGIIGVAVQMNEGLFRHSLRHCGEPRPPRLRGRTW